MGAALLLLLFVHLLVFGKGRRRRPRRCWLRGACGRLLPQHGGRLAGPCSLGFGGLGLLCRPRGSKLSAGPLAPRLRRAAAESAERRKAACSEWGGAGLGEVGGRRRLLPGWREAVCIVDLHQGVVVVHSIVEHVALGRGRGHGGVRGIHDSGSATSLPLVNEDPPLLEDGVRHRRRVAGPATGAQLLCLLDPKSFVDRA